MMQSRWQKKSDNLQSIKKCKKVLTTCPNGCILKLPKGNNTQEGNDMYKDGRYINAGTNEVYRYGHKAVEKIKAHLEPNESGFYSIPADGGKYYTFGTSDGKFGEFAKINDTFFSVNRGGFLYAKAGTEKGEEFVKALNNMIEYMNGINEERIQKLVEA